MDGTIDPSFQQRFVDLLGEQALAADLQQRSVLDAIARGADDHELDGTRSGELGMGGSQSGAHELALREREG